MNAAASPDQLGRERLRAALHRAPDRRNRTIITPEGLALTFQLASRGARLGALLIDLVLQLVILIALRLALLAIFLNLMGQNINTASNTPAAEFAVIIMMLASFLISNGWFLFFELGPRGATPGKRLVGIRIAARDGGRLSAEQVIARNLLRDVELVVPVALFAMVGQKQPGLGAVLALAWVLIFNCLPLWTRDRLRAGDLVGGTWVVSAPRVRLARVMSADAPPASERAAPDAPEAGDAYRFGEAELAHYGEYELQTLERVLRDDRPEAMASVATAICAKIGWSPPGNDETRAFLSDYYTALRARLEAGMRLGNRKADKFSEAGAEDG